MTKWGRLYHRRQRALLTQLGGRCVQCGATEGLQIDHRYQRDWSPRRLSSHERARRYAAEAARGLVQVLCGPCNRAKGVPPPPPADMPPSWVWE